ncbi:MAG: Type 2 DNA topoisomerase 6 subunit B [Myxococcota bacterium]|nr:Type 2 DNA topoisomerase 6 subunit B [Myxococcota bacterium]
MNPVEQQDSGPAAEARGRNPADAATLSLFGEPAGETSRAAARGKSAPASAKAPPAKPASGKAPAKNGKAAAPDRPGKAESKGAGKPGKSISKPPAREKAAEAPAKTARGKGKPPSPADAAPGSKPADAPKRTRTAPPAQEELEQAAPPKPVKGARKRVTAHEMAANQREISISEFFTKNRHLLGFDNPIKSLLTTVKEAVDNSLDACEEAGILPSIKIEIDPGAAEDRFRITVTDNGPGIVRQQIPKIFGKLLYGSKFHRLKQSRGQQGIGISAAGMYGQLTTGQPVDVVSRTGDKQPAHHFVVQMDMVKNNPVILKDETIEWKDGEDLLAKPIPHGTRVSIELQGLYRGGRQSVEGYVEQTAIANPHARFSYRNPRGETFEYERAANELPPEAREIKPHPHGVELGILIKKLESTDARNMRGFLSNDFSRVSPRAAEEICKAAGVSPDSQPKKVRREGAEALYQAINKTKLMAPPTNCLSPIGEEQLMAGLRQQVKADFYTARTRPPSVYRGNPFLVEVALAYGGEQPADELIQLVRFANRVPLLYQQSACAVYKSAVQVAWKNYQLQQSKGALPSGPLTLAVHIASVWVPFTSESKEAIAHYPEIIKEMKLAMQECGRELGIYLRKQRRMADEMKKRGYIEKYIPHIGESLEQILKLGKPERERTEENLHEVLSRSRKM